MVLDSLLGVFLWVGGYMYILRASRTHTISCVTFLKFDYILCFYDAS